MQKSVRYSNYLKSRHDIKSQNKDSINYYSGSNSNSIGWGNWLPVTLYNDDVFEMFKSSGAMPQVDDKELLMSIWKAYHLMKTTQNMIDGCLLIQKEVVMADLQRFDNGEQIVMQMRLFYVNEVPLQMVDACESIAEFTRETISKLEKSRIVER